VIRRSRKARAGSTGEFRSPKVAASGCVIHSGIDRPAPSGRLTVKALTPRWMLRAVTGRVSPTQGWKR